MEKHIYKQEVEGSTWQGKIKNFSDNVIKDSNGDIDQTIHMLIENIMIRELILELQFDLSSDDRMKLYQKFSELIHKADSEKVVKNLDDYR